ncbi:mycothiol synthase [Klugiella xanthotipulae]|uniref:Mycothiol acetyltransferase n=1 Tax=Klugiella xanthotipulae TaxID=244735 RepID=A0A543HYD6_9MICO|nr:mycothiol synthase [Klugiella xanthotipulae]TQM63367.1 mycothiol synthase [Klugiella xanthotipulae]
MTAPAHVPFYLTPADPGGELAGPVAALISRVTAGDGIPPFSDQGLVEWRTGRRSLTVALGSASADLLGAALRGEDELELTVDPAHRRRGVGTALLADALAQRRGSLLCWAHGNSPASAALAGRHGFVPVRTLLRLSAPVPRTIGATPTSTDYTVRPFQPGMDDDAWVELNARVFSNHPEQGKLTRQDLAERQAESWFNPEDFLVLTGPDHRLVGYNWLKITERHGESAPPAGGRSGEVYAIGVAPEAAGHGLGRLLLQRGFDRLRERSIPSVSLYVEGDNTPALALYHSSGFETEATSVQYRREAHPEQP